MLAEKPCSAVGWMRPPIDQESETSGERFALPPSSVAHWPNESLAATPGAAAQGSEKVVVLVTVWGENASRMLAARMAWSYEPRSVKSGTGDHWPPTL